MTEVRSVGHVLWNGEVGGIERLVHDLVGAQIRTGLNVMVAFGQAEGPFVEAIQQAGAEVVDLALRSGHDFRLSRMVRGSAAFRAVSVLHLHGYNPSFDMLARRAGVPIVFTEHGNFGLGRRPSLLGLVKRRLQRRFLTNRVAMIAANSNDTANRLCSLYRIQRAAVTEVLNGVDMGRLAHRQDSSVRDHHRVKVVFIGRLVSFKRLERLLEAVACARRREDLMVAVVGEGPLEPELQALSRSLGVDDRVEFLGLRHDLEAILQKADVLVQPSEGEPFGLAIVEACCCGALPIVFSDAGGALEALPPDGIVVRTVEDLAETLDELVGSSALSDDARLRRANWAIQAFPIERTAERYGELYERAATGNG